MRMRWGASAERQENAIDRGLPLRFNSHSGLGELSAMISYSIFRSSAGASAQAAWLRLCLSSCEVVMKTVTVSHSKVSQSM